MTWSFNHRQAQRNANAGMYLLRTSKMKLDEEKIVHLYWTLSEVEATFRSLKSELGLRPVYHRTLARIKAHLFISVLAYQACHYLRLKMRSNGVRLSWKTVRRRLATLHRTMRPRAFRYECVRIPNPMSSSGDCCRRWV